MFSSLKKILKWIRKVTFKTLNSTIFFLNDVKHENYNINGIIKVSNKGFLSLGKNFTGNSGKNKNPIGGDTILRFIVNEDAKLIIEDHVGISNSTIVCSNSIRIENHVMIGGGCKIWDTDFHSISPKFRYNNPDTDVKTFPIVIGEKAFIGANSIILKGVLIGAEAVIGAGSVVTKNVPAREIWAGNPAKFIRQI